MGKQRVHARADAAPVRFRGFDGAGEHHQRPGEYGTDLSPGNAGGHCAGIFHRGSDGAALPCEVLGLQQSEAESPRLYLRILFPVLGMLFRPAREGGACAHRDGSAQDPPCCGRGRGARAVSGSGSGPDTVLQRGDGPEADPLPARGEQGADTEAPGKAQSRGGRREGGLPALFRGAQPEEAFAQGRVS